MNMELLEQRAEMLKVLSHPQRLCIVRGLQKHRCNVGKIQEKLGLSQSGLSQHLAKLKSVGIIKGVRQGKEICYEVVSPEAIAIAEMLMSDIDDCE
ncbi:MAG: metalloregulator ArsR/SmtB family transcription factor [Bacillota bacterium]|nr:metalloregulator ArsR/SmtB family transcription factor [Bacillota bacterium]